MVKENIDPVTFSVLTNAIEHDNRVNAVIEIDLDEEMVNVIDKCGERKTYCLDDVLHALEVVERNAGRGVNPFTERMFRELMEWNHVNVVVKKTNVEEAEVSEGQIPAM